MKNCEVKILTKCIGMDFSRAADEFSLLPANMYGSRKGRMAADALHFVIAWIRDAMRKRQAVTLTVLDIKSAFPSTDPRKLVHVLTRKGNTGRVLQVDRGRCWRAGQRLWGLMTSYRNLSASAAARPRLPPLTNSLCFLHCRSHDEDGRQAERGICIVCRRCGAIDGGSGLRNSKCASRGASGRTRRFHRVGRPQQRQMGNMKERAACSSQLVDRRPVATKGVLLPWGGIGVKPSSDLRYLGVHLDDRLNGKAHGAVALRKGMMRADAIARLGASLKRNNC